VCRLVFLLGETNDEKDQTKLEEEAHTYGDIVQVGAYSTRLSAFLRIRRRKI
jgi:hypothetical protein